jgi:hypothetical protein
MHFLREQRRAELIENLTALSMPVELARRCASYSDDLSFLDGILCDILDRVSERCAEIAQADEQERRKLTAFLQADLLIFSAYRDEANERRLSKVMLPRTREAIIMSITAIEQHKATILAAMGRQALLQ